MAHFEDLTYRGGLSVPKPAKMHKNGLKKDGETWRKLKVFNHRATSKGRKVEGDNPHAMGLVDLLYLSILSFLFIKHHGCM